MHSNNDILAAEHKGARLPEIEKNLAAHPDRSTLNFFLIESASTNPFCSWPIIWQFANLCRLIGVHEIVSIKLRRKCYNFDWIWGFFPCTDSLIASRAVEQLPEKCLTRRCALRLTRSEECASLGDIPTHTSTNWSHPKILLFLQFQRAHLAFLWDTCTKERSLVCLIE